MRIFISAGDPSGDQHAAFLVRALLAAHPDATIEGLGGPAMRAAGAVITQAFGEEPIIGVSAVLPRLLYYRRLLKDTVARLRARRTDVLVLVDYPGFNLRLAEAARKAGIKTVYYIGPQIWAWGAGRIERIKRAVDLMLVVFEFERDLYLKAGVTVRYVGHPLLDELDFKVDADFRRRTGIGENERLLGLFPGSRPAEIDRIFPVMVGAGSRLATSGTDVRLVCAMAPGLDRERYERIAGQQAVPVTLVAGATASLMQAADLALVASGTATLEAALFGAPQLVLYRTDPITGFLARMLVRVPHIGLVNLVAGREVAPEFLQQQCRPETVAAAARSRLQNRQLRAEFVPVAEELKGRLGRQGASARAAAAILEIGRL